MTIVRYTGTMKSVVIEFNSLSNSVGAVVNFKWDHPELWDSWDDKVPVSLVDLPKYVGKRFDVGILLMEDDYEIVELRELS